MSSVMYPFGRIFTPLNLLLFLAATVAMRAQVDVPTPALPAAGAVDVPLTAHFVWRPVAGAASFEIELSYDAGFAQIVYANRVETAELDIADLWENTTYYWHVRAIDSLDGTTDWSAPRSFHTIVTGAPRPTSPEDGATDLPMEEISLNFAYPTNPPSGFELVYAFDPSFRGGVSIAAGPASRSASTTGLPADTVVYWRVRVAGNAAAGPGAWSRTMRFRTAAPAPRQLGECSPIAPTNGYTLEEALISSAWIGPSASGAAARYEVRFTLDRTMTDGIISHEVDSNGLSVELPEAGTWYWQVRSLSTDDDLVDGPWSVVSWFTIVEPRDPALGAPSLLLPPDGARARGAAVMLLWDSVGGATGYEAEIGRDTTFESADSSLVTNGFSVRIAGLVPDTLYAWRVRALASDGRTRGPWSPHFTFSTRFDVLELPGTPRLILPANDERVVDTAVVLRWSAATGASAYVIQISGDSSFRRDVRGFASFDSNAVAMLEPGRRWWWRARGANDAGSGAWSEVRTFTTAALPTSTPLSIAGTTRTISLIPTPATSMVQLSARARSGGEYRLMVANMRGEMAIERAGRADSDGTIRIALQVDGLASGVYRCRILTADGDVIEAPLVVSR